MPLTQLLQREHELDTPTTTLSSSPSQHTTLQFIRHLDTLCSGYPGIFSANNPFKLKAQTQHYFERKAWQDNTLSPYVICVAGGTASGKTSFAKYLNQKLQEQGIPVAYLTQDSYYKDRYTLRKQKGHEWFHANTNLDAPSALNLDTLQTDLTQLKKGKAVFLPKHDMSNSKTTMSTEATQPTPFVILEGLFTLSSDPEHDLQAVADLTIFVETSPEQQQQRWAARAPQRNIDPDSASGKAMYASIQAGQKTYIQPTRDNACLVLHNTVDWQELLPAIDDFCNLLQSTFYATPVAQ